jgi:hypothetical protein
VRHEARERASNGPGDSIEVANIVSKSGVPGSRYGSVVLIKITETALDELHGVVRQKAHYS